jgi:hypothetical protein
VRSEAKINEIKLNWKKYIYANLHLGMFPSIYRRLLLENVLMLASRRISTSFTKFPNASEGIKIVCEKFGDPLEVSNSLFLFSIADLYLTYTYAH